MSRDNGLQEREIDSKINREVSVEMEMAMQLSASLERVKPLVLMVDDEPAVLSGLMLQLEGHYDLITAKDGRDGFELARTRLPDLILSDLNMPHCNGLEFCRALRSAPETKDIPVVMLTSAEDRQIKVNCLDAGATDFLSKPCATAELILRVRNLCQMHRQKLRLERLMAQYRHQGRTLLRQEKMAGLGRICAGLIHEINNPFNFALQALELLKQSPEWEHQANAHCRETISDVELGVKRVTKIISDLRSFAIQGRRTSASVIPLKNLVESALRALEPSLKSGITTTVQVSPVAVIRANETQMVDALAHVLRNAYEAVRAKTFEGGKEPCLLITEELSESYVRMTVRDNGIGIPGDMIDRIFDPFFTTKDVGEGMGLGLAISHSVFSEHGVNVEVKSEPAEFTAVTIIFPLFGRYE